MKTSSPKHDAEANAKAISIHLDSRAFRQIAGQRNHDLRLGPIPDYVDREHADQNDVLIRPPTAPQLRQICIDRRALRETQRAFRHDSAVVKTGIISFGHEAQVVFAALDRQTQNEAFQAVAEAIASRLKTTLEALVVHRDESAIHAHFMVPAVNFEGNPISKANSLSDMGRLQDLAAETIAKFASEIERGTKRSDRLKAGAKLSDTIHRSVKQLHWDLPAEIERKRASLSAMQRLVDKTAAKLLEDGINSDVLAKRLKIYERRLAEGMEKLAALERAQDGARAGQQKIIDDAKAQGEIEKAKIVAEALVKKKAIEDQTQVDRAVVMALAKDQADAMLEGFQLAMMGTIEPVMRNNQPKWLVHTPLEDSVRKRFNIAVGLGLRPIVEKFYQILGAVKERLKKLTELVAELETIRDDMSLTQRAKLDEAKRAFEDPEL